MNEMTVDEAEELTSKLKAQFDNLAVHLRELGDLKAQLPKKKKELEGYVYFIQAQDSLAIKIGFAVDVESRLKTLQTGNSERLEVVGTVPGCIADEKALHAKFSLDHKRGEWFYASNELVDYILEVSH